MSKENIANDYLAESKHKYRTSEPTQRKILITGVSKNNIGEAIVKELSEHELCIPSIWELDVMHFGNVEKYVNDREGMTDLICCHGFTHLDWLEKQSITNICEAINVNLLGTILLVRQFVLKTISNWKRKRIILIGSMAYNHVLNASSPYCAAKAGLNHFAECIAWELAPKGYDVYIVNPSNVENTPMTEKTIRGIMSYRGIDRAAAEAYWGAILPKDKWLQKEDIAKIVKFLIEEKSGYMSGSHIDLKGGQR